MIHHCCAHGCKKKERYYINSHSSCLQTFVENNLNNYECSHHLYYGMIVINKWHTIYRFTASLQLFQDSEYWHFPKSFSYSFCRQLIVTKQNDYHHSMKGKNSVYHIKEKMQEFFSFFLRHSVFKTKSYNHVEL